MDDVIKLGFIEEGLQLIEELETLLLEIETAGDKRAVFDGIFRIVHNIKGSARAVGFEDLGTFCHELETYLLRYKHGEIALSKDAIDRLLQSRDLIAAALKVYGSDLNAEFDFHQSAGDLREDGEAAAAVPALAAPVSAESSGGLTLSEKKPTAAAGASDGSVRVNLKRVDKLINAVGELVVLDSVFRQQLAQIQFPPILKIASEMGKIVREVQDLSMSLRMVPVKPVIQKLQRICRDTCVAVGKTVDFQIRGEENEIDKTILDTISDPLVHLVRNAIDHGLEDAAERKANGKSENGRLLLEIGHEGGKLVIRIRDDGRGLDRERIAAKALEKGLIASADGMTEEQVQLLIFAPGFSTKAAVTEVSGRGVGMDVVRTSVESLGGQIRIKSEVKRGTEFEISLPLTVAIIEGMVVRSESERFIVPSTQVVETVKISSTDLIEGPETGVLLRLRGDHLPVFSLSSILGVKPERASSRDRSDLRGIGIVTRAGSMSFAVMVDDILGQQQIVVKPLGAELSGFKRFVGSGVLGDGRPALILDLTQLADDGLKTQRISP